VTNALALPRPFGGAARRWSVRRLSLCGAVVLVSASWGWILLGDPAATGALFAGDGWRRAGAFVGALLGRQTALSPAGDAGAFLSAARWGQMAGLAYQTLVMSVLAIWIAAAGALATVMAGARPRAGGAGGVATRALRWGAFGVVRGAWVLARAVPELVWALLLVLVMPPGVLAGALALGIHNFGIVGKLCSEVVEELDPGPARALRAGGAGPLQVLAYAVIPQALPRFLTYALYRWEVVIRTTIVVGFVSAGGLGREFRLAMSFFHYTDVAMILATYFVLVLLVDLASSGLRALARG
jgi:phosphonate transport system permease protein